MMARRAIKLLEAKGTYRVAGKKDFKSLSDPSRRPAPVVAAGTDAVIDLVVRPEG